MPFPIAWSVPAEMNATSPGFTFVLDGEGTIKCGEDERDFVKGDSIFIPADSGSFYVSGKAKILHTKV